tara:strand:+ start:521 stop:670 length:150 start_codon:yes stop_codon:yes gene_type:complete
MNPYKLQKYIETYKEDLLMQYLNNNKNDIEYFTLKDIINEEDLTDEGDL